MYCMYDSLVIFHTRLYIISIYCMIVYIFHVGLFILFIVYFHFSPKDTSSIYGTEKKFRTCKGIFDFISVCALG